MYVKLMKGGFFMKKNILITYYSHSSNTKKLAELITQQTYSSLVEIVPKEAYPRDYNTVVAQAKKEIFVSFRPALKSAPQDISSYDTIFVGTPNWWSSIAPPIATFLESNDFTGKTIIPFCTHGGGGLGHIMQDIAKLCPSAIILNGFGGYGNSCSSSQVSIWLRNIGIETIES